MLPRALQPTSVAVAPVATTMATIDVLQTKILSVSVRNLDVSQTLDVTILRQVWGNDSEAAVSGFAPSTLGDLLGIGPGQIAAVDIDVGSNSALRFSGVASGAGLTAVISARNSV